MGLINATIGIGITIALLVTPIISDRIGWRVNFLFTSLACGALFLYSLLLIKEEKALHPIGNARLPDSDAPYSFGKLLSNPMLILIAVSMGCLFIEVYGVTTWIPPYLTDIYQFSPSEVGLSSMMLGLVMIPAAITTGYFATNMVRILWLTLSGGVIASIGLMVFNHGAIIPVGKQHWFISILDMGANTGHCDRYKYGIDYRAEAQCRESNRDRIYPGLRGGLSWRPTWADIL